MNGSQRPIIIVGGGLAGGLAALAIRRRRSDQPLLLIEQGPAIGGNHIWSFFDSDVAAEHRWLVDPAVIARWDDYEVRFPGRVRVIAAGYNSVSSAAFDHHVRSVLKPEEVRVDCAVEAVDAGGVILSGGERIDAGAVIDARGAGALGALELGWQKFVGQTYQFAEPHGIARPVIMDASVDQTEGYRFVYVLPLTAHKALIEDTYYSTTPDLDMAAIRERILAYLAASKLTPARLEGEESGVLPVAMGGDFDAFWPAHAEDGIARIGMRGGFFHPTTGYSLPDAVRIAVLIAANADLTSGAMARLVRGHARDLWRGRRFYRLLSRLLFEGAAPADRYRVLRHFYRLDPALIGRFYSGRARMTDKIRILIGKPPIPIVRALGVLARAGASR